MSDASSFETRTLLFSDIEGSTRLQIATGDAYADILSTHRKLIRDAVAAKNGTEHRTAGDGFFFVFRSARDALIAAVDAQLALKQHEWPAGQEVRVRMGLHVGDVGESDNDVVGLAINEASRIMDAAHGGQILVSSTVNDLTAGALPSPVVLQRLGAHRLKDFDVPVQLLQVQHPGLSETFPPPRTRDAVVDLPLPRTSFVGREREVSHVLSLLAAGRHVTLTGVGGSGKTRLALEVATLDTSPYPDGVFFVDLAPLADPDQVVGAVATSVNVKGDASDLNEMLVAYLDTRRVLIVLDNCEHLVDAAADAIDLLLGRCPGVTVLATSREALQIEGEQSFSVRSLAVEDAQSEGVMLFASRARGVKPDFEVTDENRDDVLAVCQRLDGIPLAIELAAGRVDHMSIADIAKRLDDRFELLVGGRRRRAQRQQTLQAAMDWSWALLTDDERMLLRALAVFAGPFTLDAAAAVSGSRRTLDLLRSLVSKSLVDVVDGTPTRYKLLETVRLYAQDQLVEAGEAAERRDAHRDWYLEQADAVPLDEYTDLRRIKAFLDDHANMRAALDWTLDQDRPDVLARLVLATGIAWTSTPGHADEGRRWLSIVAEDESQPPRSRADAYEAIAVAAMVMGELTAIRPAAARSFELDPTPRPVLTGTLWLMARYPEAIEMGERFELKAFTRFIRSWAAGIRIGVDPARAIAELEPILDEVPEGSVNWDSFFAYTGAALAHIALGSPTRALETLEAVRSKQSGEYESWFGSLARFDELVEALALTDLGRFDEARALLLGVARAAQRDHYPLLDHDCVAAFAYMAFREGDLERAAQLLDPVVRDTRSRVAPMGAFTGRFLAQLRHALSEAEIEHDLPRTREYAAHAAAIFRGEAHPDPAAAPQIEQLLEQLTS